MDLLLLHLCLGPPRAENGSQFWIIVVAAVVGCVAVLVCVAWYVKRRKNNSTERGMELIL